MIKELLMKIIRNLELFLNNFNKKLLMNKLGCQNKILKQELFKLLIQKQQLKYFYQMKVDNLM